MFENISFKDLSVIIVFAINFAYTKFQSVQNTKDIDKIEKTIEDKCISKIEFDLTLKNIDTKLEYIKERINKGDK